MSLTQLMDVDSMVERKLEMKDVWCWNEIEFFKGSKAKSGRIRDGEHIWGVTKT